MESVWRSKSDFDRVLLHNILWIVFKRKCMEKIWEGFFKGRAGTPTIFFFLLCLIAFWLFQSPSSIRSPTLPKLIIKWLLYFTTNDKDGKGARDINFILSLSNRWAPDSWCIICAVLIFIDRCLGFFVCECVILRKVFLFNYVRVPFLSKLDFVNMERNKE